MTEKWTRCETPSVVCVIPELLREQEAESCEHVLAELDITTRVLESR